ncbi:N-6 adenine-specific DNA methyltransferase 1 [Seminavis robusta]|uniref:N-6 adenine-specific DNA methyltransferase 1 n=1 Tax=Seminavis robusta TaxID=568900 RepID=A0A9N8HB86_9STRA|nr:N-6 adenine-specific DNA methyltransferase 1 [Seminavis robusta]|eukprot:Sro352_g124230.1 N-6 adenine-specific DNA methyltransferase 1 (267) ;mRNA; f:34446-35371
MTDWHPLRPLDDTTSTAWSTYNEEAEKRAKNIPCAAMPSLDHLKMKDFEEVYEPSDDTYLLLDGLQHEITTGTFSNSSSPLIAEIGCGTGVASVFLASQLFQQNQKHNKTDGMPMVIVTDINPKALQVAKATAAGNNAMIPFEAVQCDLVSALLPRLAQSVDALIFNPPYVPTPDDEVGSTGIEASWAGGEKGRRVVDRAIPKMAQILARPRGVAYMITVDDNEPEVLATLFRELGLQMKPLVRRRAHNEFLTLQKITWTKIDSSG